MTDEELVERLRQFFGDHTMTELELIDVVRAATGTEPVTARERVQSLVGTALICEPPGTGQPVRGQDSYRLAR